MIYLRLEAIDHVLYLIVCVSEHEVGTRLSRVCKRMIIMIRLIVILSLTLSLSLSISLSLFLSLSPPSLSLSHTHTHTHTHSLSLSLPLSLLVYINHRPVFGLLPAEIAQSFKTLGKRRGKDKNSTIERTKLLRLLQEKGMIKGKRE